MGIETKLRREENGRVGKMGASEGKRVGLTRSIGQILELVSRKLSVPGKACF